MADFVDNLTGNSTPQNAYDYAREKSNSPFDQTHRFVASGQWKLPFGKDGLIMANDSKVARLLGNWQLNGILTLKTGLPTNITAPDNSQTGGNHAAYANCVANPFAGTTTNRAVISTQGVSGVFISPAGLRYLLSVRLEHVVRDFSMDQGLGTLISACSSSFRWESNGGSSCVLSSSTHSTTPIFANPATNLSNTATFGKVSSTINDPRQIQLAGKFYF